MTENVGKRLTKLMLAEHTAVEASTSSTTAAAAVLSLHQQQQQQSPYHAIDRKVMRKFSSSSVGNGEIFDCTNVVAAAPSSSISSQLQNTLNSNGAALTVDDSSSVVATLTSPNEMSANELRLLKRESDPQFSRFSDYFVICGLDLDTGLEPDRFAGELQ